MTKLSLVVGAAALAAVAVYAVPALTQSGPRQQLEAPAPRPLPSTPAAVPSSMGQVQLTFAPVVKRVIPAVVNVYARTVTQVQANPFFNDPFFSQFFGQTPEMRQRVQQSLGSGVIVRPDGIILTNNHVVAGGTDIVVALSDKREFKARVLLSDARIDLAVLKIDPGSERLPVVPFADSDRVQVGDLVLAVGDPFGVGQTVTMGIVSALARTQISAGDHQFFIQTDAAINPGNSGGALVTTDGRLAGINTAIVSRSGGNVGIGFAIPANLARRVVEGVDGGKVSTVAQLAWVGASGQPVTSDIAKSLGLPRPGGVLIKDVYSGDVVTMRVAAGSAVREVSVTLALPPENPPREAVTIAGRNPLTGARVVNLSPAVATELQSDVMAKGVAVLSVGNTGFAGRYGFQPGDIIRSVNGMAINRTGDLVRILNGANSWDMVIERGGRRLALSVDG